MKKLVADRGLQGRVRVDSAGTIRYHVGERADPRMRRAAERYGYELESIARQFAPEDFDRFDLILAMDRSHLRELRSLARGPQDHVKLFSDFLPAGAPVDVPDPYYGGEQGFDHVVELIEQGCPAVLDHLLDEG